VDHWAKSDDDRKAVLLTTYRVAGTYAAHYSAVRTAIGVTAAAVVYAVLIPAILPRLVQGDADAAVLIQSGVAAAVMLFGQFLSAKLLARTNRARAVALSVQNRRDDDLLFHESSESPGPPACLDSETRGVWVIDQFPIFYEDLFLKFKGIRSGWRRGSGNLVYLGLTVIPVGVFVWALVS
jgi:hypothetical protein